MTHLDARRLLQSDAHVLPLNHVPLKIQDLSDSIPETIRHDQNSGGESEPRDRENGLHGPALNIPNGDSKSVREEMPNSGSFNQSRPVVGWWLRPHRFSGRK